jgi:hypothetical protein
MVKPRVLPETLPEMEAVDGDESGLVAVADAWAEVYAQMKRAFFVRDYGRAVDLGQRFVARHPDHADAKLFVEECRTLLEHQLAKQLPLERAVVLRVPLEKMEGLDSRTAFLLAQADGRTSIDDLADLASMPRSEALRIIAVAIEEGVLDVEDY